MLRSFVDVMTSWSASKPDDIAFRFLTTGDADGETDAITYGRLGHRARAIGGWLQERGFAERQALLLYPSGLDFVAGYLGCLHGAVIAVPAALPRGRGGRAFARSLPRLSRQVADAGCDVVLTTRPVMSALRGIAEDVPGLAALTWVPTEEIGDEAENSWRDPSLSEDSIAFLQYTSGSTTAPRGVVISHRNLLDNQRIITESMGHTPELVASWDGDLFVSWLPLFHDMGLILPVLNTLYTGASATLFSPQHFAQQPERWLTAVSRYRAHTSGSPNFGYELCLRNATPEWLDGLDLAHWRVAVNAAEPVRATTLRRFAEAFGRAGFRPEAFYPSYGLAEATLMVSGGSPGDAPVLGTRPDGQGQRGSAASPDQVSCGFPGAGMAVAIADPDRRQECPAGQVGEIWLAGASIAGGYWRNEQATREVFGASLGDGGRGYLRTGDLGFLRDGHLFVTGRRKDLLVIDGENHYPQDVELTAEAAHALVRPGCVAAFTVAGDGEAGEQLVVVAEVSQERDGTAEVAAAIREAVSEEHGLSLRSVLLVRRGTICKTSSGKIQRQACRTAYLDGTLCLAGSPRPAPVPAPVGPAAVQAWLVAAVARAAGIESSLVGLHQPIAEFGLGSRELAELSGGLSALLGHQVDPALIYDHPTIAAIAHAVRPDLGAAPARTPVRREPGEPIAVVGMACRLPGGVTEPSALWRLLADGGDAVGPFPDRGWDVGALYDPDPEAVGKTYVREGCFISQIDGFDAAFFGITPREAAGMDPQQRLLLETSWEALERAGIVPATLAGSMTAIYIGMVDSDYLDGRSLEQLDGYVATGSAPSVASGRIAYTLGTRGPAITVDTACSSSLTAVHLAAVALRSGECDLALAGGATLMVTPQAFVEFSRVGALSPTARCRSFSDDADGTCWAEGVGIVVLKRLGDAQRDGDEILAVLRGTALNQDGRSQGLTAPNGLAQEQVIRLALERSGLAPADIDYVEAHGTGTRLGDPIEANALAGVFAATRPPGRPLYVGSIKSNIGHSQASAGLAGLIKAVLCLQHGELPRTLHVAAPSSLVDWDRSGLRLVREPVPWPAGERPRRAGVNAFGISGTNAHLIVEEAPREPRAADPGPPSAPRLFALSALTDAALRSQARQLTQYLGDRAGNGTGAALPDIGHTLARRRSHFPRRSAVLAADRDELLAGLDAVAAGRSHPDVSLTPRGPAAGKLAFVFPGHGGQWPGMGADLLARSPVFAAALSACDDAIGRAAGWSVRAVLRGDAGAPDFDRVDVVQPVLFALTSALAATWRSLGVEPDAVVGHSQGEIAAAYSAGMLSLDAASAVVTRRARTLLPLAGLGGLLSVELPAGRVTELIAGYHGALCVAGINSGQSTVVSGESDPLADLEKRLTDEQIPVRRVRIAFASHSPQMETVREDFLKELTGIAGLPGSAAEPGAPTGPAPVLYSTVLAEPVSGGTLDAGYWYRNLREPVRFADTVRRLLDDGVRYFVEAGPHPTLGPLIDSVAAEAGVDAVSVCSLRRGEADDERGMLRALGRLYAAGYLPDWSRTYPAGAHADLPTYPFERQRHWRSVRAANGTGTGRFPLSHTHVELSDESGRDIFQTEISLTDERFAYLCDHRVTGAIWLPAAVFLEMVFEAVRWLLPADDIQLADVRFERPLALDPGDPTHLQVVLQPPGPDGSREFSIAASPPGGRPANEPRPPWTRHVIGRIQSGGTAGPSLTLDEFRARCTDVVELPGVYARFAAAGIDYGPAFRALKAGWRGPVEALARLAEMAPQGHLLHPALLDAAFHGTALLGDDASSSRVFVPAGVRQLSFPGSSAPPVWTCCQAREYTGDAAVLDVYMFDERERLVLQINGFESAELSRLGGKLFEVKWQPRPAAEERPAREGWLILADESGTGDDISRRLGQVPHVIARRGDGFHAEGPGRYLIDPGDPDHLTRLLDEAFGTTPPGRIVQLTGLDAPAIRRAEEAGAAVQPCILATLHLVQAIAARSWSRSPRLFLVTRGSQAAAGSSDVTHPEQALVWGFGNALSLERPELDTTLIDLPAEGGLDALWDELRHADDEPLVALREAGRLVPRLARTRPDDAGLSAIRPDRTYLVTGGLGGLGRVAAGQLVRQGARQLAVLGRGEPSPEAAEWIAGLRADGVTVHVVRADVADRVSLETALTALRKLAAPLAGVVHAAGVLDDATLPNMTPDRVATVLAPKVAGTVLLTELVPEADFVVFFSSVASVLGSAGQSAYAAANAFMDAWAHHLAIDGRSALSIDWGAWRDVGMVTQSAARATAISRLGLGSFSAEDGGELFGRILHSGRRQLVPLELDHEYLAGHLETIRGRPLLHDLFGRPADAPDSRELIGQLAAATTDEARRELLEAYLKGTVTAVAGGDIAGITPATALKELGLDSLMLVNLSNAITRDFGVKLPPSTLFSADVGGLVAALLAALAAGETAPAPVPVTGASAEVPDVVLLPATRDVLRLIRSEQQGIPPAAHTLGMALRLRTPVGQQRLLGILTGLAGRHAALRTAIVPSAAHGQELEVRRHPAGPLLRWTNAGDEDVDAGRKLSELMEPAFDLTTSPLWRFELIETGSGDQTLVFGAHHSVSDGQSMLLVATELTAAITGEVPGTGVSNRDIDYLLRAQPAEPGSAEPGPADPGAAAEWRTQFEGCRRLDLAPERPAVRSFRAGTLLLDIPADLLEQISVQAAKLAITPAAFCLGVLTVFLAQRQGRNRFAVAVPVDTRIHVGALDAVGFFGIPLPVPADAEYGEPAADVLRRMDGRLYRVLTKGATFSGTLPLLAAAGLHRANAPLVEVYFNYMQAPVGASGQVEVTSVGTGFSDLDLMVTVLAGANSLHLDYNLDLMDEAGCAELGREYLGLLAGVAADPALRVRERAPRAPGAPRAAGGAIALAATFALGDLPRLGENALNTGLTIAAVPHQQVLAAIQEPGGLFAQPSTAVGVMLVRAADLVRSGTITDDLLAELADQYPAALQALAERTRRPLVVGFLPARSADDRLERWEQQVAARLRGLPGIAVLGSSEWIRDHSVREWFDDTTDEVAHLPFSLEFQAAIALTLAGVVRAVLRRPPKVIAVDGDGTLWTGSAGEIGPDSVYLGGPRALLARRLLQWRAAGVLLVLVSSNDDATVDAVLRHQDSVLRPEHFSLICAGWEPKAKRISDAANLLNLKLDSFLFLDDNPVEVAAVRSALPEVLCVTCPAAGELAAFVSRLWPLVPLAVTAEDASRADFYRDDRARDAAREQASFAEFLAQLALEVDVAPLSEATAERSAQLIRRVSQFTLRAPVKEATELARWQREGEVWTASARDRFGDYGQIGVLAIGENDGTLEVRAWVLSCRALGRGVEERLLRWLADRAEARQCAAVRLAADRTPSNEPARRLVAALDGGEPDDGSLTAVVPLDKLRAFRSWDR